MEMFVLNRYLTLILLIAGVCTIIFLSMMALMQNNYKKLLGYTAVSQVGYMVLGFGLGSPIGIAGGLFHMINHALYKSGLFLAAGSIERQTGKEELNEVGGLSKCMPLTFIAALIFALSTSGIPPLNGFASKWMIYQAIIDFGTGSLIANKLWILWLALAVIGSALTVAVFIKFIAGAFLGRIRKEFAALKEVPFLMWIPMAILGIACLIFGIFITALVIPYLLEPVTGPIEFIGMWNSSLISMLIVVSILVGLVIYLLGNVKNLRVADSFVGGEVTQDSTSFSVSEFYKTFTEFRFLRFFYNKAHDKIFDVYDQSRNAVLGFSKVLSKEHTGVMTFYAFWIIAGLLLMMILLL
jgi:formate hydrogenlyase subunit 3/multisubunit Na+/H+ antiporter MnhD subunit